MSNGVSPTRVLLADDHHVVRHGLRLLIDAEPDLTVVAEAGDGIDAVQAVLENDIDLAILDVSMPRMTGINAAREIIGARPNVRVLMLSMHDSTEYLFEALRAGASGYVLKSGADRDLIEACRAAMRDEPFLYPSAIRTLIRDHLDRPSTDAGQVLTPRETEIVKLIAEAHSSKEIAELLVISPKTVERHRANILEKLGMSDRVELTRYAIRRGLVEP
jgi:DNA-binding NarL/FixJ family response regulator